MAELSTNAGQVAAALAAHFDGAMTTLASVVSAQGAALEAGVKRRASGRPGPRLITGNYVRSINHRTERTASTITCQVGTDAPQARRLELGFFGTDSLGRRYHQPPFPHWAPAVDEQEPIFVAEVEAAVARLAAG